MEPRPHSKSTLTILWNKAKLLDPATPASTVESILRQAFEGDEDIVATLLEVRGRRFGAYAALLDETIRIRDELAASQEASRAARRKLDDAEASRAAGRTVGDAVRDSMAAGCFRSTMLAIALAVTFVTVIGQLAATSLRSASRW